MVEDIPISECNSKDNPPDIHTMSDHFALEENDLNIKNSFTFNSLLTHQQQDKELLRKYSEKNCEYTINTFMGWE